MNNLTREQAIKRIKDIREGIEVDHICTNSQGCLGINFNPVAYVAITGAWAELKAIFDITEEELK